MLIKKNIVIFVEGPDGIGKTTIAKLLSRRLDIPYIKMARAKSFFKRRMVEEMAYVFNNVLLQLKDSSFVVDRGPLSSLIYSLIYQRKSKLDYIYPLLEKLKPLVIYLMTSTTAQLFERKFTDKIIPLTDRIRIARKYEEYFKAQQLVNVFKIDTKKLTPTQIIKLIIDKLKKEKYIEESP